MVLRAIDREKPTLFPAVPTIYIAIINAPDLQKYDLSSLKICISGAAPLPAEVQSKFGKLTGSKLAEGYGLTETSPVTHANPPIYGKQKVGSIGLPPFPPNTEARIVDMRIPPSRCRWMRRDNWPSEAQVMKGYLNRPRRPRKYSMTGGCLPEI